ncbi:hypothetical protein Malapachy_3535 [Malassezia pachydermatis]|uniref:Uncharacterized protein n=1 Tax=Malassezia pachydermatis TaxID=77020 RepID=A0A0M8MX94_9BASI|nr:hypothetical protein Malapachy_3535 [Malassezia pachydermatis]KOS16154.1 hypothetical protein Malapachy_3535 [Malassezia pachydermatis]
MSVRQLKEQVLSVLRTSKQPTDDVLGKPFSDATPDDLELYVAREDAYVPLAAQAESSQRADDGTPLCMHCHLEEGMAVYVGFRAPEQDAPGDPMVQEPSLDDDVEDMDAMPPSSPP